MIGVISLTIAQMLEGDDRQVPEGRGPDGPLQLWRIRVTLQPLLSLLHITEVIRVREVLPPSRQI